MEYVRLQGSSHDALAVSGGTLSINSKSGIIAISNQT